MSTTRRRVRSADRTQVDRLLAAAILLAADFHDLGKLTAGFQGHLSDSVRGRQPASQPPLRHEFVSIAVLRNAIDKSGAKSDAAFLAAISDMTAAAALFETAFANLDGILRLSAFHEGTKGVVCSFLPDPAKGFPFMRVVTDLILSHHRVPEGQYRPPLPPLPGKKTVGGAGALDILDTRHVNRTPGKAKAPVKVFLVPAAACHQALRHSLWSDAVARDARRALSVLPDGDHLSGQSLFSGAAFSIGRLALMLGDHQGSAIKMADTATDPSSAMSTACYANTATVVSPRRRADSWTGLIDDEGGFSALDDAVTGRFLADTWPVHVHKVRRRAIAAFAHLRSGDGWPCVLPADLPSRLTSRETEDSPFVWQTRAADALACRQQEEDVPCPTLGFLLASTGTGKTVAIPRMFAAMSGGRGMRLNVCLGLRSLTLQTGEEYLNRVGFLSDQAIVVIGSRTALRLHELEHAQDVPDGSWSPPPSQPLPGRTTASLTIQPTKWASEPRQLSSARRRCWSGVSRIRCWGLSPSARPHRTPILLLDAACFARQCWSARSTR